MIETIQLHNHQVFASAQDPFIAEADIFAIPERSWLAIWLFVCESCDDLLTEDLSISQVNSIRMARRLQGFLEDGTFQKWQDKWKKTSQDESCSETFFKQFINFCGFSGGFQV
jgi:hypothetical protein